MIDMIGATEAALAAFFSVGVLVGVLVGVMIARDHPAGIDRRGER